MPEEVQSDVTPLIDAVTARGSLVILPQLTDKQIRCLRFIHEYFAENRYYPTQREVAKAMDLQSSTAEIYLEPLRRKGYLLRKVRRKRRNIRLTSKARQKLELTEERPVAA